MNVDSIVFDNFSHAVGDPACNSGGVYRFYDKDGEVVNSGNIMYNSINYSETENFLILGHSVWSNTANYYPVYAFYTGFYTSITPTNNYIAVSGGDNGSVYYKIKFKKPLPLSKIECNTCAVSGGCGTCANGCDVTVNFIDGSSKKYTIYNGDTYRVENVIKTINLPVYEIDSAQFVKTTINSQAKDISRVNGFKINCDIPENTDMKFAISIDNGNIFKVYKNGNWNTILEDPNIVLSDGNTRDEIESIAKTDLAGLISNYKLNSNIDVYIAMITHDKYEAPFIKSFNILYTEVIE